MRLHNLKPNPGAKKARKRVGRGRGSGHGKTSTRGTKGYGARSGSSTRAGFEGGQMPLIRRLPKRGFSNAMHRREYIAVNLSSLEQFEDGANVDVAAIEAAGLANGNADGIKILARGELTKKLNVTAHRFSGAAREAIEKLGGTCTLVRAEEAPASEEAAEAPAEETNE